VLASKDPTGASVKKSMPINPTASNAGATHIPDANNPKRVKNKRIERVPASITDL
jgi:hypothetical protein